MGTWTRMTGATGRGGEGRGPDLFGVRVRFESVAENLPGRLDVALGPRRGGGGAPLPWTGEVLLCPPPPELGHAFYLFLRLSPPSSLGRLLVFFAHGGGETAPTQPLVVGGVILCFAGLRRIGQNRGSLQNAFPPIGGGGTK